MEVVERFEIEGRGTVAVFRELLALPRSAQFAVVITHPNGDSVQAVASHEMVFHGSGVEPPQTSALFFPGLAKEDLPIGSRVEVQLES